MTPELRQLYQEIIIDHGRQPRNFGELEVATHKLDGFNPLCGDKLTLFLKVNSETSIIEALSFNGSGCAISVASASLMTECLKNKTVEQAQHFFEEFHQMVTDEDLTQEPPTSLGKLAVLAGVKSFPARVKCATLAWHTLNNALEGNQEAVSTE